MTTGVPELPSWHQALYSRLTAAHAGGRLGHAYLLHGPEGTGKLPLARRFGHLLLCRSPHEHNPCGQCDACHLLAAGTHPDFRLVAPEGEARVIKIEQVRAAIEFLGKTGRQDNRKVLILAPAEAMNINAANALLKVLEEPSPGTLILLVSHQPSLLPATVRGRCQSLKCDKPHFEQAGKWLESKGVGSGVDTLLTLAGGAPFRALALADKDALHERTILRDNLRGLLAGEAGVVQAATNCAEFDIENTIEAMMLAVNDILRFTLSDGEIRLKDPELLPLTSLLPRENGARRVALRLHRLRKRLLEARKALAGNANPNGRLLLEGLFFAWAGLARSRE